jgi:hypothetical protein
VCVHRGECICVYGLYCVSQKKNCHFAKRKNTICLLPLTTWPHMSDQSSPALRAKVPPNSPSRDLARRRATEQRRRELGLRRPRAPGQASATSTLAPEARPRRFLLQYRDHRRPAPPPMVATQFPPVRLELALPYFLLAQSGSRAAPRPLPTRSSSYGAAPIIPAVNPSLTDLFSSF